MVKFKHIARSANGRQTGPEPVNPGSNPGLAAMKNKSYSYQDRKGLMPISWEKFHGLCKSLAIATSKFNPDIVLGIARGGLYPATLISHLLQKELYPIRLSRRVNDIVRYQHPVWFVTIPGSIKGKRVLVVDEICDSGETLNLVKNEALKMGAIEVKSAVLYSHKKGKDIPDFIGLITNKLILNPWDREILKDGKYIFHPEYVDALKTQNIQPEESLLLGIKPESLAKEL